jgi:lysophospholipase L1-like esterase
MNLLLYTAILSSAFCLLLTVPLHAQTPARGLGNTFAKLAKEKTLTVGYFGGSITEGAGASRPEKTWRALTTAWFREQFPQARIVEVNAAIGGTGSHLGAFRCQEDLLCKKPDLVFLEYAVNDSGGPETTVLRAMEGIVRQIWKANPRADIVFVYTTTKSLADAYERGETPNAVLWDQRVADRYGIPAVNVGRALWQAIHGGKGTWETLTVDTVHPNDAGYAIYAEVMRAFLESRRNDKPARPMRRLPAPLTPDPLENGRLADAWTVDAPGWTKENESLAGRYPHRIACDKPGTELVYRFKGTAVGLYWIMGPDSGDVEWAVDGSPPRRVSSWDIFALHYARANAVVLTDTLPPGEHTLRLKILPDKNPQSTGTAIRIGAFLVQ